MPINNTSAQVPPASAGFGGSMLNTAKAQFEQASVYSDLNSLDSIRKLGQNDETAALKKAAKEFEAFFMNMMLKSMRQAGEVIGADSMMNSQQEKMFTGMLDEQLSVDLSQKGLLGIADLMMAQLQREKNGNSQALSQISAPASTASKTVNAAVAAIQAVPTIVAPTMDVPAMVAPTMAMPEKEPDSLSKPVTEKDLAAGKDSLQPVRSQELPIGIEQLAARKVVETGIDVASTAGVPQKKALFERISDFVSTLAPLAQTAAQKLGLDPKVLLAQAALETGWGKYVMHDEAGKPGFNLFGIKAGGNWDGKSIEIDTLEVVDQQIQKVNAAFRKYDNLEQSFDDYVSFISDNPRYQKALNAAENAENYVNELQASGYATDPDYAQKILRVFNQNSLQKISRENIQTEVLGPR